VEVVQEALAGNVVRFMGRSKKKIPSLDLPKIRRNPFVEIVPINLGCLNQCTYCKTKHARGDLHSYTHDAIVERCASVLSEGVVEVRITSEDTGAYGRDIDTNLPALLREVVEVFDEAAAQECERIGVDDSLVPTLPMLRVGMTNPPYILEHLDEIGELLNHPRVFSFLHVPVQCGSNAVLGAMQREYTRQDFQEVVDRLRAACPDVTIATDIICGFPGETDEDFQETLDLIDHNRFSVVNISQFYSRPGTPAARMRKVPTNVVKERSRALTKLFNSYHSNMFEDMVGTRLVVHLTEIAADGHNLVGHSKNYTQVLVAPDQASLGTCVEVDIVSASTWHCVGEVVRRGAPRLGSAQQQLHKKAGGRRRSKKSESSAMTAEDPSAKIAAADTASSKNKKNDPRNYWLVLVVVALMLFLVVRILRRWLANSIPWGG
jgi:threonylcarbamoyladenosine tRNA methylthiotransferase CDKAL1